MLKRMKEAISEIIAKQRRPTDTWLITGSEFRERPAYKVTFLRHFVSYKWFLQLVLQSK